MIFIEFSANRLVYYMDMIVKQRLNSVQIYYNLRRTRSILQVSLVYLGQNSAKIIVNYLLKRLFVKRKRIQKFWLSKFDDFIKIHKSFFRESIKTLINVVKFHRPCLFVLLKKFAFPFSYLKFDWFFCCHKFCTVVTDFCTVVKDFCTPVSD